MLSKEDFNKIPKDKILEVVMFGLIKDIMALKFVVHIIVTLAIICITIILILNNNRVADMNKRLTNIEQYLDNIHKDNPR